MEIAYCNENYVGHLLFHPNAANLLKILLKCVKIRDLDVYNNYAQTTRLFQGPYFVRDPRLLGIIHN
jgi:hypothetical protein